MNITVAATRVLQVFEYFIDVLCKTLQGVLRPWQTKTHCCRHKGFPVCPRAQQLLRTQKMFLILFRNILCPQQMFPSLRSPRNIMGNNVSAKMCPRLSGPLAMTTATAGDECRNSVNLFSTPISLRPCSG